MNLRVGSPCNATARSTQQGPTIQQKDELASGKRAKRVYLRQNFWTSTDVLQDAQVVLELGRIEQKMVDKGDAIKLETFGNQEEIAQKPDVNLKKRKLVSQTSIKAERQAQRQTHPRGENLSKDPVREMRIYWRRAAVNKVLCDTPSVDLSRDRTAPVESSWKVN